MEKICQECQHTGYWSQGEWYCEKCNWSTIDNFDYTLVPNIIESSLGYIWKTDMEMHELIVSFAKVHRRLAINMNS